jgi:hypothetical protein
MVDKVTPDFSQGFTETCLHTLINLLCLSYYVTCTSFWHTARLITFLEAFCKGGSSIRAAAFPEILRKIKLHIWIKAFVRRYVLSLKEYEFSHFKLKYLWQTISAAESKKTVPCPDLVCSVNWTTPSGGKTAVVRLWVGLPALQPRVGLKEDFVHLFTFPSIWNQILFTIFNGCSKTHVSECFNFGNCNIKINMNKKSVQYSQGFSFMQLTPAEKTEIKSSGHATSGLVLDHQANTKVRKFNTAIYMLNINGWVAVLKEMLY